jgi:hypothetical protein
LTAAGLLWGCAGGPSPAPASTAHRPCPVSSLPSITPAPGTSSTSTAAPATATFEALGLRWSRVATNPDLRGVSITAVASGRGGLLAIGSAPALEGNSLLAWTSADGHTWDLTTPHPPVVGALAQAIVAVEDRWVIVGSTDASDGAATAWASEADGAWRAIQLPLDQGLNSPVYVGNRVAGYAIKAPIGGEPMIAWSSPDLVRWESQPFSIDGFAYVRDIVRRLDGTALAWGRVTPDPVDVTPLPAGEAAFWTSADGRGWDLAVGGPAFVNAEVGSLGVGGPGGYAALGCRWDPTDPSLERRSVTAWWSSDGVAWSAAEVTGQDRSCTFRRVVGSPDGWFSIADVEPAGSAIVAGSPDARTWTVLDQPARFEGTTITGVARLDDHMVAVGSTIDGADEHSGVVWIADR